MFNFNFIGKTFKVDLESGQPEVTPFDSGVEAHVLTTLEEVSKGQYFPHPNDLERALSDALGGDFNPGEYEPIDSPKGAIE